MFTRSGLAKAFAVLVGIAFAAPAAAQPNGLVPLLPDSPAFITTPPAITQPPVVFDPTLPPSVVLPPIAVDPSLLDPSRITVPLPACSAPGVGGTMTCACDVTTPRSVWGSGPYTSDSDICTAAAHAGLLVPGFAGGWVGTVTVAGGAGCGLFVGSTNNGITTRDYQSWPSSFYFPQVQSGQCFGAATIGASVIDACPRTMPSGQHKLACNCAASATSQGSVWGTGIYTNDSAICVAAVHDGRITTAGGLVLVVGGSGADAFTGSTQNGVTSMNYVSWPGSISFR